MTESSLPSSSSIISLWEPALMVIVIMSSIVTLLWAWETLVHMLRQKTPTSLLPVLESILGEMGGLGFIGLLVQLWHPQQHDLLETFEFLHTAIFQVVVSYFLFAGAMVYFVLSQLEVLRELEDAEQEGQQESATSPGGGGGRGGEKTTETVKDIMKMLSREEETHFSIWKDLVVPNTKKRMVEFAVVRRRFRLKYQPPEDFRLDVEPAFATYLKKLVHLNPFYAWLPLIPIIALGQALDASHGVLNATSENAMESAGYFVSTPIVFVPIVVWHLGTVGLCLWNVYQLNSVEKFSDVLTAVEGTTRANNTGNDETTPFMGTKSPPSSITWKDEDYHQFLDTFKYHAWFTISLLVRAVMAVIPRDIQGLLLQCSSALTSRSDDDDNDDLPGNPQGYAMEFIIFSWMVLASLLQLWLTPSMFWNFCLVSFDKDSITKTTIDDQLRQVRQP